jgi:ATP-binding cassette, subfamily B, bacterial PglK
VLQRIWRLLDSRERRALVRLVPLVLLTAGFELVGVSAVIPFMTLLADPNAVFGLPLVGPWIQTAGIADTNALLRYAGVGLAMAVLITNGLVMLTRYRQYRFAAHLTYSMSTRLLGHYLAQPYAFTLARNSATLTNAVTNEVTRVTQAVGTGLGLLTSSVTITALLVFLIALDPLLALTSFGVLGALYGAVFLTSRRYLTRTSREFVAIAAERLKAVAEAMGGFKDLKVAGLEGAALRYYQAPALRQARIQAVVNALSGLPRYALEAIAVGGVVVISSLMAGREGAFGATLPLLGAYVFGALRLLPAMQNVFAAFTALRNTLGAVELLEADLSEAREAGASLRDAPPPLPFQRAITLRGVSFRYPASDGAALSGIDLSVTKGRSLGIVGLTGSGKTTLVNVLLGLLEPNAGTLEVDGVPVAAADRRAYRRLFGFVPQEIFLVDASIRRNVALGTPDGEVDEAAVRRACAQAQVDEFIEQELTQGYDTHVGERGIRLSGGQRQRIGIARALYHQPAVLVFDEATSALDVHTERRLFEALEAIARDRTLVMIAHRLETVAKADHVVVLEGGRVEDAGSATDVLGRYRAVVAPHDHGRRRP